MYRENEYEKKIKYLKQWDWREERKESNQKLMGWEVEIWECEIMKKDWILMQLYDDVEPLYSFFR